MIRVYHSPRCHLCELLLGHLKQAGIEFESVNIQNDPIAQAGALRVSEEAAIRSNQTWSGNFQLPVLVDLKTKRIIFGYDVSRINQLLSEI